MTANADYSAPYAYMSYPEAIQKRARRSVLHRRSQEVEVQARPGEHDVRRWSLTAAGCELRVKSIYIEPEGRNTWDEEVLDRAEAWGTGSWQAIGTRLLKSFGLVCFFAPLATVAFMGVALHRRGGRGQFARARPFAQCVRCQAARKRAEGRESDPCAAKGAPEMPLQRPAARHLCGTTRGLRCTVAACRLERARTQRRFAPPHLRLRASCARSWVAGRGERVGHSWAGDTTSGYPGMRLDHGIPGRIPGQRHDLGHQRDVRTSPRVAHRSPCNQDGRSQGI